MKVGVMQPYFFPYIGYFQLMKQVDKWVIFDQVQFIDKGWINRNRILHPSHDKEWQYITIPLHKKNRFDKISAVQIHPDISWRDEIRGKLSGYRKQAPFYFEAIELVNSCLDIQEDSLSGFLGQSLQILSSALSINVPLIYMSELDLQGLEIRHPGQWAVEISRLVGASMYINPPSGHVIFREDEFRDSNIELRYLSPILSPYDQRRKGFVAGLSIIDVIMWNGLQATREMLHRDFRILTHAEVSNGGQ